MRSQFIPVRKADIVAALAAEAAPGGAPEADRFAQFCRLLALTIHYEYFDELEALKHAYFHFNPRLADGRPPTLEDYAALLVALRRILERANFTEVPAEEVARAERERGVLPVEVKARMDDYSDIRMFKRGQHKERDSVSEWFGFRARSLEAEVYDDVVLVAALRPRPEASKGRLHRRHRPTNGAVMIKFFHDIASADLNTLLPDVRVIMNMRDRWTLGLPALIGGVPLLLKLAPTLAVLFLLAGVQLGFTGTVEQDRVKQALAVLSGVVALGSFAIHQWLKYQRKALRYLVEIKDSLYFRNVNNNAGVFDALVGAAEEQAFKEAVIAYRFLLAEAVGTEALDAKVETWLSNRFGVDVDFEVDDGLAKLERYGLLTRAGDSLCVPPVAEALRKLDERWDGYFAYNKPGA